MSMISCELCDGDGGEIIWRGEQCRVVRVLGIEADRYPGFCRVIWNSHVKEMTDLVPAERSRMMQTVMKVEQALREQLQPEKINLASLGNMTPHLHWHVIPRYRNDATFPNPIWVTTDKLVTMKTPPPKAWVSALQRALNTD